MSFNTPLYGSILSPFSVTRLSLADSPTYHDSLTRLPRKVIEDASPKEEITKIIFKGLKVNTLTRFYLGNY